ncbi:MAG: HEAT repeat domain-containing protein [Armatimonadota bacterium]
MTPTDQLQNLRIQLRSRAKAERKAAARALGDFGRAAVPCLLETLRDDEEEVRAASAKSLARIGPVALESLAVRVRSRHASERREAAWALGFFGPEALGPLEDALGQADDGVRVAAVKSLQRLALPQSVPLLCRALHDPAARHAAVEALGEFGDQRAVEPLMQVLRGQLLGRSGRRQVVIGWTVLLVAVLVMPLTLLGQVWLGFQGSLAMVAMSIINIAFQYFTSQRRQSLARQSIVDALLRIGERCPAPELRTLLPDLQSIERDRLQSDPKAREASRAAAERIEALTEGSNLPLPGCVSGVGTSLPRVGEAPTPDARALPRV